MINIQVLGSTSSGNCTLIWDEQNALMIDCGFGTRYVSDCLRTIGSGLPPISGLLLTHSHNDHAGGGMIKRLARRGTPLFCHRLVRGPLLDRYESAREAGGLGLLNTFDGCEFSVGTFSVSGFEVPHDSPGGCYGFNICKRLESGRKKITVSTDIGYSDDIILERFIDSDVVIIESNHDDDMLEESGRPRWLIDRIKKAHLSNAECAGLVGRIVAGSTRPPQAVMLAHISRECNIRSLAEECARSALKENGHSKIKVYMTYEQRPSERVCLI